MKRSQAESSGVPPAKKQVLTKMIPPMNIGSISTEDEMNLKVLQFQNKKLGERLEELKIEEEKLKEQVDKLKKQRESDLDIISVINRHWMQLDEDIKTILQRYEGIVEEDSEQTSNEATLSYLDFLANLDSEEVRQEVAKRSAATKEHTRKLLHYVEISGPYSSTVSKEKPSGEIQVQEKAHKDQQDQQDKQTTASEQSSTEQPNIDLDADNKQLRELVTSLHQKQQTTSLEFSEIRDKYALAQKEIAQLNTELQDATYELQKANHRVDNLVKRLNELEDMNKRLREGNTAPGEPGESEPVQNDEVSTELEDLRDLAKTRLEELEKLNENFITSQQELEKLKLEINQMPESAVLQSAPYKCLQSQFSVLYGEVTQLRQQLDDTRRVLSTTKTQHVLQLEQVESNNVTIQKKYKAEVSELHDALLQVKRDYDLLRMEFEQNLKANEQTGPMTKEMSHMLNSLQSHNQQLKVEVSRYKRKFSEAQVQVVKLTEEVKNTKESGKKGESVEEDNQPEGQPEAEKDEQEAKASKSEEEGEIEEGEEITSSSKSNDMELKELRASLKKSQETQKEMKLVLDVYKGAAKDLRDKVELLSEEKRLKEQIEEQKAHIESLEKELEKHKGALADEEAIRRLKMAEETIEQLQKNLAATKQEEDAVLAEMEFTGQAFEEMQEQNVRLLQQLREKDDANLKLMSERIKGNQIQKQIKEEMDVLADQVTSLNTHRDTQTQLVKKLEEREKALQNAVTSLEKELNLRQQAMELHKRKAIESAQAAQDVKIRFDSFQQQFQEAQESLSEQTRASEEEAFKSRRVQEECASLKRRLEKEKKNVLYGAADEILLEEIKQYKAKLTCPCCNTRKKDAILTKCFHVFCFECLKTRYDTRQRKCPKCNATFGNNDFHRIYL